MNLFTGLKEKNLVRHLKEAALIGLMGSPMGFFFCLECLNSLELFVKVALFSATIWIVMWKGNELIHIFLDIRLPWLQMPLKRLLVGIILAIVYPVVAMFLINVVFYNLWGLNTGQVNTFWGVLKNGIPAVVITFLVSTFLTARSFFLCWRQLSINEEKIKREAITSRYESLKNQVNPHFLFNSLNVLTTLVYKDQDLAAKFIKQLANVYRYVLDMKDKELVDIGTEIEFLRSYAFMQQIRYESGLKIRIDVPADTHLKVVPLSVQMLLENAIKHNVISRDEQLNINISMDDNGYLVVSNNLQRKPARKNEDHTGIGLENITARYEFLTERPVVVEENAKEFSVKIPILKLEE